MIRDRKDIPRFKDVSDADWSDYKWQLRNRLTTTEDFEDVLNLTDAQRKDLDACMGKFRVSVTPYYASLMDPDDSTDPVRMQGVPTPAELGHPLRGHRGRRLRGLRLADAAHHAPLPGPRAVRRDRDVQHVLPPLHAPSRGRRH